MDSYYYFDYPNACVELRPAGKEAQHDQRQRCFLLDNSIDALSVKMRVARWEYNDKSPTCAMTLSLYKEDDCQPLLQAWLRLDEWQRKMEDAAKSISMSHDSAANILRMYEQSYAQAADEYRSKVVAQVHFSYAMPADKEEDTVSLLLPIDASSLQSETPYRLIISKQGEVEPRYGQSPRIGFFHADKPASQLFHPLKASIKVLPMKRGKTNLQKAVDYRNYDGYFDDVHFDDICQEVEVNPPLVSFLVAKDESLKWQLLPIFSITLTSGGETIYHDDDARTATTDHRHYTVLTPLSSDYISCVGADGMVTATLRVFDTTLASFSFSVKQTVPGCLELSANT